MSKLLFKSYENPVWPRGVLTVKLFLLERIERLRPFEFDCLQFRAIHLALWSPVTIVTMHEFVKKVGAWVRPVQCLQERKAPVGRESAFGELQMVPKRKGCVCSHSGPLSKSAAMVDCNDIRNSKDNRTECWLILGRQVTHFLGSGVAKLRVAKEVAQ